jgi:MOSC domain-containing protein YiiM
MLMDSDSTGDATCHRAAARLVQGLAALAAAPTDRGSVVLAVARREGGRREAPARIALTPEGGVEGDAWGRRPDRKIAAQVTVMQAGIAALIANGQALELFGDNLFLDLDISAANLPPDSQVEIGDALLEMTPLPHNGCRKFKARFGEDALRFVQNPETRGRNMRGIHMRVIRGGEVGPGDEVRVIRRA